MFDPLSNNLPKSSKSERHAGKALVALNEDSITLVIDCGLCQRINIGPIPLTHLMTVTQMLSEVAKSMGLSDEHARIEVVAKETGTLEEGMEKFEQMLTDDPPDSQPIDDPWTPYKQ